MNTLEGNRLIADFMGLTKSGEYIDGVPLYHPPTKIMSLSSGGLESHRIRYVDEATPDELLYHISWDWLVPVLKKIGNDYYICDLDIEDVWIECVQFIQWYNKQ